MGGVDVRDPEIDHRLAGVLAAGVLLEEEAHSGGFSKTSLIVASLRLFSALPWRTPSQARSWRRLFRPSLASASGPELPCPGDAPRPHVAPRRGPATLPRCRRAANSAKLRLPVDRAPIGRAPVERSLQGLRPAGWLGARGRPRGRGHAGLVDLPGRHT